MAEPDNNDFGAFYRATIDSLRRYLARFVRSGHDAQDLAHDAYRRVYEAAENREVRHPQAFLYTTARRLALKHVRRRQIAPVRDDVDPAVIQFAASTTPGTVHQVIARQDWERVLAAIAELPPGCRSVLQLSHRDGLSHAEISDRLGIAVSTVEKQHARALRLLRERVQEDAPAEARPGRRTREAGKRAALG